MLISYYSFYSSIMLLDYYSDLTIKLIKKSKAKIIPIQNKVVYKLESPQTVGEIDAPKENENINRSIF